MNSLIPSRESNPFNSCWLGPHGLDYVSTSGFTPTRLVGQLAKAGWRGQVVGPHGVGKSTLLAAMRSEVESVGRRWLEVRFRHSGRQSSPIDLWRQKLDFNTLLVIDGYEQLSWLIRKWVQWRCAHSGAGLLVTTHQAMRLPTLLEIEPTAESALQVFRQVSGRFSTPVTVQDARNAFNACNHDMREMFDKLYDLHERRSRDTSVANNRRRNRVLRRGPVAILD